MPEFSLPTCHRSITRRADESQNCATEVRFTFRHVATRILRLAPRREGSLACQLRGTDWDILGRPGTWEGGETWTASIQREGPRSNRIPALDFESWEFERYALASTSLGAGCLVINTAMIPRTPIPDRIQKAGRKLPNAVRTCAPMTGPTIPATPHAVKTIP